MAAGKQRATKNKPMIRVLLWRYGKTKSGKRETVRRQRRHLGTASLRNIQYCAAETALPCHPP